MAGGWFKRMLGIPRVRPYSTYLDKRFKRHIKKDRIKTIIELGSRDVKDAILLSKYYGAKVFAFECNPDSLALCRENIQNTQNVVLVEKAVWNENKRIKFFPVVASHDDLRPGEKAKNIGASSCYVAGDHFHEKYEQSEIEVDAVRLDGFCKQKNIGQIDLLCMDLQGAEYQALLGLGDMLSRVRYIISEIEITPIYEGQHCFDEIEAYLKKYNFKMVQGIRAEAINGEPDPFGNYLFVNQSFR